MLHLKFSFALSIVLQIASAYFTYNKNNRRLKEIGEDGPL